MMKTCGTCKHYYAGYLSCEAPLPMWLRELDPLGNYTTCGGSGTTLQPDTDADSCKAYYKRRMSNVKGEHHE